MTRARRTAAAFAVAAAFALAIVPAATASAVALPTFTVAGTIEDSNGVGLVGATYNLFSGSDQFSATSTAGGAYSIANVPAGEYASQLSTTSSGYDLVNAYVTIPVGGTMTAVLVLPLRSEVKGTVTDPSNNPVSGVLVSVGYLDTPFGGAGSSNGPNGTGATGTFDFGLAPGRNIVSYAPPAGSNLEYQWYSNVHTAGAAAKFTSAPDAAGSPFVASIKLVANTDQATGAITLASVGQSNTFAYLYNSAGDEFAELQGGVGGAYSSAGLPDGDYTIQAHYSVGNKAYASQMQPFTVAGADVSVADLVLVPDPGASSTGVADAYTASKDTVLSIPAASGVTSNDTRSPAGQLYAVLDTAPTHGHLFLQYDGALTYAPDDGFIGTDTFTYLPSPFFPSFGGGGDPTTVTITVGALPNTGVDVNPPITIALLALIAGLGIVLVRRRIPRAE
jgi:LPXTG-motif cell wall-anchored protein